MKRDDIGAALYAAMAVITFGHSTAARQKVNAAEYANCLSVKAVVPQHQCWDDPAIAPMGGIVAGAFWPLYWSWEVFS